MDKASCLVLLRDADGLVLHDLRVLADDAVARLPSVLLRTAAARLQA